MLKGVDNCFKDFKISSYKNRDKPVIQRFEENYIPVTESGCWLWLGAKDRDGYGIIRINYVDYRTHRFSYDYYKDCIPADMCVCHKCDEPSCVNPDHLWLGTTTDNVRDKFKKGRFRSGRNTANGRFISLGENHAGC